jgi:hypothetical protein
VFREKGLQKGTVVKKNKIFSKIDAKVFAKTKLDANIFAKTKIDTKIVTNFSENIFA